MSSILTLSDIMTSSISCLTQRIVLLHILKQPALSEAESHRDFPGIVLFVRPRSTESTMPKTRRMQEEKNQKTSAAPFVFLSPLFRKSVENHIRTRIVV